MSESLGQCGRVDPWIFGWSWIKFTDLPDPVKRPHLGSRRCPEPATVSIEHSGLTFCWCAAHADDPICGVPKGQSGG